MLTLSDGDTVCARFTLIRGIQREEVLENELKASGNFLLGGNTDCILHKWSSLRKIAQNCVY